MTIVTERMNANKPPPATPDPKSGKLAPGQVNNNKDLDVELRKDEPGFFGSFFAGVKGTKKKAGTVMEAVGDVLAHHSLALVLIVWHSRQPSSGHNKPSVSGRLWRPKS
jgi:hypothetical protein